MAPQPLEQDPGLKRSLGPANAAFIVVGNIVGIGIFVSTGIVAEHVGSPALLFGVWIAAGLLSMAGAMSVAELGALMPHAGGDYIYLKKAYGPLVGFLSGWSSFLVTFSGCIAALALGFSGYADSLIPSFSLKGDIYGIFTLDQILAISVIFLLSLLNLIGVKVGGMVQFGLTFIKVAAIGAIVFMGFRSDAGSMDHFKPFFPGPSSTSNLTGFGLALIPVLFTFQGWNATTYIAGEIKDPGKNIPCSILAGVCATLVIYLAVNAVYLYSMPLNEMSGALDIASDSFSRLFGPSSSKYLSLLISLSILGSLGATILIAPRIYFAMARDGLFLKSAGLVHGRYRTPAVSIKIQFIWSSILVMLGGFEQLLTYVVFVIVLFSTLTTSTVFVFRKRFPDMKRPYKVWGYPYVPGAYILISLLIMGNILVERPLEAVLGLLIVGLGAPVYYFTALRAHKNLNAGH